MEESQYLPGKSLKEVLESYSHIELTEDEEIEGILWAKYRKEAKQKSDAMKLIEDANRKKLFEVRHDINQLAGFLENRAGKIFGIDEEGEPNFKIDQNNAIVYNVLLRYFCEDPTFYEFAIKAKIKNPSLKKGIMLAGDFGVGKTDLMALFAKNYRMVYDVVNAKKISGDFEREGDEALKQYLVNKKNPVNDASSFYQPESGLCIDDLGTEDVKVHFGNRKSVLADILEVRYSKSKVGQCLHATTNLTADQIKEYYGGRIASRMKEIFNIIELPGKDRRK